MLFQIILIMLFICFALFFTRGGKMANQSQKKQL